MKHLYTLPMIPGSAMWPFVFFHYNHAFVFTYYSPKYIYVNYILFYIQLYSFTSCFMPMEKQPVMSSLWFSKFTAVLLMKRCFALHLKGLILPVCWIEWNGYVKDCKSFGCLGCPSRTQTESFKLQYNFEQNHVFWSLLNGQTILTEVLIQPYSQLH